MITLVACAIRWSSHSFATRALGRIQVMLVQDEPQNGDTNERFPLFSFHCLGEL